MSVTLIAADLDGTLLNSEGEISSGTLCAIRSAHENGIRVVLATTRNRGDVEDFADKLGIADPIICSNGTQVFDRPGGRCLSETTVPVRVVRALAELADAMDWGMVTTVEDTTYYRRRPGQSLGPTYKHDLVVASNAAGAVGDALRILVWQQDAIRAFRETCEAEFSGICYTTTFYDSAGVPKSLGVFPLGADKGTALSAVRGYLSIPIAEVLAIGDNENDIPMFGEAGVKVAVRNGTATLKRIADAIAPSNDEDGAAWAIRKHALP